MWTSALLGAHRIFATVSADAPHCPYIVSEPVTRNGFFRVFAVRVVAIISGPVAWIGLLFKLAAGVAALCFIFAMAACKPCHADAKGELWLTYGVAEIHHVVAWQRT